jgi:phosphoribosylanthranilate isomerase
VQFHGRESPDDCRAWLGLRVIKAFRIRDEGSLAELPLYGTDAWLLDTHVPGQSGGTGITFDWSLAQRASALGRQIILAGGLNPNNVSTAIRQARPYAVDVSSGVESAPGKKDIDKMRQFMTAVASAFEPEMSL